MSFEEEDVGSSCGKKVISRVSMLIGEMLRNPHLMHTGKDEVIGESLKRVADIDGDLIWRLPDKGEKMSRTVAILILQPTAVILEQQSDDSKVGVRPSPSSLALM
jgi:hypothetical protein